MKACGRTNGDRRRRGFTLLELLVVVAIIIIIATLSLVMVQALTKGQSVKSSGRITQGAFAKSRQLAAAQRITHFLVFLNGTDSTTGMVTGRLEVHRSTDRNAVYDGPNTDPIVDQPILLPKGLRFNLRGRIPTTNAPYAYLAFISDGSIVPDANYFPTNDVSSSTFDSNWTPATPSISPATADITVENPGLMGKCYMDYTAPTGKLRQTVYIEN